jgi:hypothetical protein
MTHSPEISSYQHHAAIDHRGLARILIQVSNAGFRAISGQIAHDLGADAVPGARDDN